VSGSQDPARLEPVPLHIKTLRAARGNRDARFVFVRRALAVSTCPPNRSLRHSPGLIRWKTVDRNSYGNAAGRERHHIPRHTRFINVTELRKWRESCVSSVGERYRRQHYRNSDMQRQPECCANQHECNRHNSSGRVQTLRLSIFSRNSMIGLWRHLNYRSCCR
jgi:hypothetical protein